MPDILNTTQETNASISQIQAILCSITEESDGVVVVVVVVICVCVSWCWGGGGGGRERG